MVRHRLARGQKMSGLSYGCGGEVEAATYQRKVALLNASPLFRVDSFALVALGSYVGGGGAPAPGEKAIRVCTRLLGGGREGGKLENVAGGGRTEEGAAVEGGSEGVCELPQEQPQQQPQLCHRP